MEKEKVVATLRKCVQISPDDWELKCISKVFPVISPIQNILAWAESEGYKNPQITDINFSTYCGEETQITQP